MQYVISDELHAKLGCRFDKYLEPSNENFEPLFLMCMLVDPSFGFILTEQQRKAAQTALLNDINLHEDEDDSQSTSGSNHSNNPSKSDGTCTSIDLDFPPALKKFRYFRSHVVEAVEAAAKSERESGHKGERELRKYIHSIAKGKHARNGDSIGYWLKRKATYPHLWKVAIDYLSMPVSSTTVERVFSVVGMQHREKGIDSKVST